MKRAWRKRIRVADLLYYFVLAGTHLALSMFRPEWSVLINGSVSVGAALVVYFSWCFIDDRRRERAAGATDPGERVARAPRWALLAGVPGYLLVAVVVVRWWTPGWAVALTEVTTSPYAWIGLGCFTLYLLTGPVPDIGRGRRRYATAAYWLVAGLLTLAAGLPDAIMPDAWYGAGARVLLAVLGSVSLADGWRRLTGPATWQGRDRADGLRR